MPEMNAPDSGNATHLQCHFLELLAAEIVKQQIRRVVVGDKHVDKAVVIVIGKHDAHALAVMLINPIAADTSVNVPSPLL